MILDPNWARNRAHAAEIERRTEEERRRQDPNYARLQDELEVLDRRKGLFGFREPKNQFLRFMLRALITIAVVLLLIVLPLSLFRLLALLFPE